MKMNKSQTKISKKKPLSSSRRFFIPLPQTFGRCLLASCMLMGVSTHSATAIPIVPDVLSAGDKYHLLFVSSVSNYTGDLGGLSGGDSKVQSLADLAGIGMGAGAGGADINWTAILSTPDTNAVDRLPLSIGSTTPLYLTDGVTLIATGYADFWDGSILNPINIDEMGIMITTGTLGVWTGSRSDGTVTDSISCNFWRTGFSARRRGTTGFLNSGSSTWIQGNTPRCGTRRRLYAMSEELTVSVPELSTFALLSFGLLGFTVVRCRKY